MKRHPKTDPAVRIPPLFGDESRSTTVLKYLESHHGLVDDDDCSDSHYFTEHDLHGKNFTWFTSFLGYYLCISNTAQRLQQELQQHMQLNSRSAPSSPRTVCSVAGVPSGDSRRPRRRDRWRGTFKIRKLSACKQS